MEVEKWSSDGGEYTSEDEGTEDYRRGESATHSKTVATLSRANSVGAISPLSGSPGTLNPLDMWL